MPRNEDRGERVERQGELSDEVVAGLPVGYLVDCVGFRWICTFLLSTRPVYSIRMPYYKLFFCFFQNNVIKNIR